MEASRRVSTIPVNKLRDEGLDKTQRLIWAFWRWKQVGGCPWFQSQLFPSKSLFKIDDRQSTCNTIFFSSVKTTGTESE